MPDDEASEADSVKPGSSEKETVQEASGPDASTEEGTTKADEDLSPFLRDVRSPISDEAPAGESILYDEDFRALKTQIDAIGSASGAVDYEKIVALGRTILTEKSKDLRAAGYLVLGEARHRGAEGATEAFRALRLLIDEYWEDLYPEPSRMRGRGNALQFVGDRLPEWLDGTSFEEEDRGHLVSILDELKSIQDFALQEMGEHAPSLSKLKTDLESEISDLPEAPPDAKSDFDSEVSFSGESETTADSSSERGISETRASSLEASVPSEVASENDATQSVRRAVRFYREEDLTKPLSYRLLRTLRWAQLRSLPPNDGGTTRFEAPREQRRDYLMGLLEEERYETLVREGESSLQGGTFHVWLDLQHLVAAALDALGASYEGAYEAVMRETALLLRRVPRLPALSYSDGTPFASALTTDWIEMEVRPWFADEEESGETRDSANEKGAVTEDYENAREELMGGDLERALSIMTEGAASDGSRRESFYRQLSIANLCVKGDKPRVARSLLAQLDAFIEEHSLDIWHPSLAVDVWATQYQCCDQLAAEVSAEEAEALRREADQAFDHVCRTDPARAVSLKEFEGE